MPNWILQTLLGALVSGLTVAGGVVIDLRARVAVLENNEALFMQWGRDTGKVLAQRERILAQVEWLQEDVRWLVEDKQRQLQTYRERASQGQSQPLPSTHPLLLQGP